MRRKLTDGESSLVNEYAVWTAISYLDSSTDYREYLRKEHGTSESVTGDLVFLDGSKRSRRSHGPGIMVLMFIAILLIAGFVLLIVHSF